MTSSLIRYHLLALILLDPAHGAEFFGIVRDPAGLPVAAASIELRESATGAAHSSLTTQEGAYHFAALPPGPYTLTARKAGFVTLNRSGIELRIGDRIAADLNLVLGDRAESIEVTVAAPILQTTGGTLAYTIDGATTRTLPLDGRNFIPLIALAPGVMLPPANFCRASTAAARAPASTYTTASASCSPNPARSPTTRCSILSPNSESTPTRTPRIRPLKRRRHPGRLSLRHQRLARRPLRVSAQRSPQRAQPLRRTRIHAALPPQSLRRRGRRSAAPQPDLPFRRLPGARLQTGVTRFSTVPTAAQRQGIFTTTITDPATGSARVPFPDRTIPADRFDPVARGLLNRYPLPNFATAANYARTGADTDNADQFDTRLDQRWNAHRLFARYSYFRDDARPMTPLPDGSGNLTTAVNGHTLTRADAVNAEHTWTLSPAAVNQLRAGWTRRAFRVDALASPAGPFPSTKSRDSSNSGRPLLQRYRHYRRHGGRRRSCPHRRKHSLKLGIDLRFQRLDALQPPNPSGDYQFTAALTGHAFASFLLGAVQNFSQDVQPRTLRPRAIIAEAFVQDDWRVSPRLTLNLGVRYTLNFPSTEADGQIAVWNLGTRKLDFPNNARDLEPHNFGPRAGLAWRVSDSLAVRAGYGLVWIEQAGITTPFTAPMFPFIQTLFAEFARQLHTRLSTRARADRSRSAAGPDSGLGQGVFSAQREQGRLRAAVESHPAKIAGRQLGSLPGLCGQQAHPPRRPRYQPQPTHRFDTSPLGSQLTQQVANPYYGIIPPTSSLGGPTIARQQLLRRYPEVSTVALYRNNVGHSTYHSVQAHVQRRLSRGLTWSAAYTFSN